MKKQVIEDAEYKIDMSLFTIYEVINSMYKPDQKEYPEDVKEKIHDLQMTLDKYIYHPKKDADVIKQELFYKVRYAKR